MRRVLLVCCVACGCRPPPVVLASGYSWPSGLAVDSSSVYWTELGIGLLKVPIAGGTPTTLGVAGAEGPIAVDDQFVYCVPWKVPLDGGTAVNFVTNIPDGIPIGGLTVVDSTNVYFEDGTGDTWKAPKAGGPAVRLWLNPGGGGAVDGMAIDATNLYWTESDDWKVMVMPLATGAPAVLAAVSQEPSVLAIDATSLYWSSGSGIQKMPKEGGTPETLVPYPEGAGIAVDGSGVYWTTNCPDYTCYVLRHSTLNGRGVETLASGKRLTYMTIDANNVYWIDDVKGEILKAPK